MPAYVIGQITIKDEKKWQLYRDQVPATLAPWQAELVFRGVKVSLLAGQHRHTDVVVIRFASQEKVNGWFNSEAYQQLTALRNDAADVDLISYDS